eukprot:Partr_v1_DN27227_c2_g1_i1_m38839 putative Mechanosensitive ion channel
MYRTAPTSTDRLAPGDAHSSDQVNFAGARSPSIQIISEEGELQHVTAICKDTEPLHQAVSNASKPRPQTAELSGSRLARLFGRWIEGHTLRVFWRVTLLACIVLVPGIVLHFSLPRTIIGLDPLLFFGIISTAVFLLPFYIVLFHVFHYHMISADSYTIPMYGNILFYLSRVSHYSACVFWLLSLACISYFVLASRASQFVTASAVLGVLAAWTVILQCERVAVLHLIDRFNMNTFVDRVRELLFLDFMVEVLRERRRQFKLQIKPELKTVLQSGAALWNNHEELKRRFDNLIIPDIYLNSANAGDAETMSYFTWKKLLDHFYRIVLRDEELLEVLASDDLDEEGKGAHEVDLGPPGQYYHHLHEFKFEQRNRKNGRARDFNTLDDKAARISTKLYNSLRKGDATTLDIDEDIVPIFEDSLGRRPSSKGEHSSEKLTDAQIKVRTIPRAVHNFFINKGESSKISERDLRLVIQRSFRERRRLIDGLSGMVSVTSKISDFTVILLCGILLISTLSIFGVNAFGALLSVSSVFVSFAFLFGRSAKNLFEGLIFIYFVHPFDVGDRILVSKENYLVEKIGLLTTELERFDGRKIYMPNSNLSRLEITNIRRSPKQSETITIEVSITTAKSTIMNFIRRLEEFVEREKSDFEKGVDYMSSGTIDMESMILEIVYTHRTNWQNWDLYIMRRSKFFRHLCQVLKDMRIDWTPLTRPIAIVGDVTTTIRQMEPPRAEPTIITSIETSA